MTEQNLVLVNGFEVVVWVCPGDPDEDIVDLRERGIGLIRYARRENDCGV